MYKTIIKPLLFNFSPEQAHHLSMSMLVLSGRLGLNGLLRSISHYEQLEEPVDLMGLRFRNRIGLAAGFDKNGEYILPLSHLGFGHIEAGTVTPRPQSGNPLPRLFRLPTDEALINRMGFNNEGVKALAKRIEKLTSRLAIIGGNIGKNKDTTNEKAVDDYLNCMQVLHPLVDYFTVNVSSPNTPGLRALQEKEPLLRLLSELQHYNQGQTKPRPILLKIAPDLTEQDLDDIVSVAVASHLAGVIATNTTISRNSLSTNESELERIGAGGLSGAPLLSRSLEVVRYLRATLPSDIRLIGVGGVSSAASYRQMRSAGADLVQIYTGFIYEGPRILANILGK